MIHCIKVLFLCHVRRILLRSVSAVSVRTAKTSHPQDPSSFQNRTRFAGLRFCFFPEDLKGCPSCGAAPAARMIRFARLWREGHTLPSHTHSAAPPIKSKTARPLHASSTSSAFRCAGFCFCHDRSIRFLSKSDPLRRAPILFFAEISKGCSSTAAARRAWSKFVLLLPDSFDKMNL